MTQFARIDRRAGSQGRRQGPLGHAVGFALGSNYGMYYFSIRAANTAGQSDWTHWLTLANPDT